MKCSCCLDEKISHLKCTGMRLLYSAEVRLYRNHRRNRCPCVPAIPNTVRTDVVTPWGETQGLDSTGFVADILSFSELGEKASHFRLVYNAEKCIMNIVRKTNNYWQTLRKRGSALLNRKVMWWIIKLVLIVLRLVCKLIDFFSGADVDA